MQNRRTISRDSVVEWIRALGRTVSANKEYLSQLDAAIGDADHGVNLDRGFQAVSSKLSTVEDKDIGTVFKTVGMTLVTTVGGASGPLYGTFFIQMGSSTTGKMELTLIDWLDALDAGVDGVMTRGKANLGDKTMIDTLLPAVGALRLAADEQTDLSYALAACKAAAGSGMRSTIPLIARKGRASYLGERSVGHQDPGATSAYLLFETAAEVWS
jgi:dihydroxyacetone kinase-like protein